MIDVPFLTEAQIEAKADALLAAFSRDREPILGPPVPLEDKFLYYLGLRLHMDDLHARFGVPRIAGRIDILAALWIEEKLKGAITSALDTRWGTGGCADIISWQRRPSHICLCSRRHPSCAALAI